MKDNQGVAASPPGLRPYGAEPATQSQAEPLVPNAGHFPRIVSHEEALEAAKDLIDAHFNNKGGRGVYISVPAKPDNTDVLLVDYIKQQRARDAAQGGEARQGGDSVASSVHEHPVGEADAPEPLHPTSVDTSLAGELMPCPFWGMAPNTEPVGDAGLVSVECTNLACDVAVGTGPMTKAEAIAAWNTRQPPQAGVDRDAVHDLIADVYERGYREGWDDLGHREALDRASVSEGCAQVQADFADRIRALKVSPTSERGG